MRIIFMGTPDFSVGTLEALVEAGHEVCLVVSQPDKPKGRGKEMQPTPVKEAAMKHGIPVYQPKKIRDPECVEELRKYNADVMVVIAFGQIIPKEILEMTPYGCINVHASLLPKYRGAARPTPIFSYIVSSISSIKIFVRSVIFVTGLHCFSRTSSPISLTSPFAAY